MIPKIFHFTGPEKMTESQTAAIDGVRKFHPDWEIKIWHDKTPIENSRLDKYLSRPQHGAQRGDLIRLDALFAHGGVYLDTDVIIHKSFDQLIAKYDFFIGTEDGYRLTNAVIGAAQRHPAIDSIIGFLEDNEPDWSLPPNETTGPTLFARILRWRSDVNILPRETFYPYNWDEEVQKVHRLSYSEHLWAGSWLEKTEKLGNHDSPTFRDKVFDQGKSLLKEALRPILRSAGSGFRRAKRVANKPSRGILETTKPAAYSCSDEIIVRTAHGHKIVLDGRDLSITPDVVFHGWHERAEELFVRRIVRGGDWFVDVGANVGTFAILAASRCGPLGRVFAFEPNPHVRNLLRKSAVINWYHDRIRVFEAGLNDEEGNDILTYYPHRLGDAQVEFQSKSSEPFETSGVFLSQRVQVEVSMRRLDDIIPVDLPIKMIKIDAEGHEPKILEGSRRLLTCRAFEFIMLEAEISHSHRKWKDTLRGLRMLTDCGYVAGTVDGNGILTKHSSLDEALGQPGETKTLIFAAS